MYEELIPIVKLRQDDIRRYRQAIANFCITARAAVISGSTILGHLYRTYEQMEPSLHNDCGNDRKVDLDALNYALQRLPEEIARAEEVFIKSRSEDLQGVRGLQAIDSLKPRARRRTMYDVGEGYVQMIARDGETDIFDILTSLIIYGKEAGKIKHMLGGRPIVEEISDLVNTPESERKNRVLNKLANTFGVDYESLSGVDAGLNHRLFSILTDMMRQQPDQMRVEFDNEFALSDNSQKIRDWRKRIGHELAKYDGRPIILISSDTHSVVNCLTGFARENHTEIMKLAEQYGVKVCGKDNLSMLYGAVQKLCKLHPELFEQKKQYEESLGVCFIKDEFHTGIDVQVIDTARLDYDKVDPRIDVHKDMVMARKPLILNIDYAFGREGRWIMAELCEAFGKRMESVSITGKAGIVCGDRFDVMLPNAIISQVREGIYRFPGRMNWLQQHQIEKILGRGRVHSGGPMLTVPGTAIQNDLVLMDYMTRFGILGLEMEATPYCDSIEKACLRGTLGDDVMVNVGYWGSDNPLKTGESLAQGHMAKGCEPSYALILGVLSNTLNRTIKK
jgi:hypothetical protein